jgi:hypothetical protein
MSLARPFEIQNGMDFSLNHLEDANCQKKSAMVQPCILFMVDIERIIACKDG